MFNQECKVSHQIFKAVLNHVKLSKDSVYRIFLPAQNYKMETKSPRWRKPQIKQRFRDQQRKQGNGPVRSCTLTAVTAAEALGIFTLNFLPICSNHISIVLSWLTVLNRILRPARMHGKLISMMPITKQL